MAFSRFDNIKDFEMGDYLGISQWTKVIREEKDATRKADLEQCSWSSLTLEMEEGSMSQEMHSSRWKGKETNSPL